MIAYEQFTVYLVSHCQIRYNDNGPEQATVQLGGAGSHHATRWQHMQVKLIEGKGGRKQGGGGRREGAQIGQRRKGRGDFLKVNGWESG